MAYTLQFAKYNGAWMPTHSLCQLTVINSHLANSPHNSHFTALHFKDPLTGRAKVLPVPGGLNLFGMCCTAQTDTFFFLVAVMYKLQ